MKRVILVSAGVVALLSGVAIAHDDEEKETRRLDLNGFDQIEISGVYNLEIEVGSDFFVELSGHTDELDRVKASVSGGVLDLSQRDRKKKRGWKNDHDGIDAVIRLPSLTALDISGVVDGDVKKIDTDRFTVRISGVGDLELQGTCGSLKARVSGVGELDADKLECRAVDVRVSGVGDASVFASDEVDANVSGMGDIDVYGSPERVTKSDSMFADVTIH